MKVFRMNDCDWMAGQDLQSCIDCYLSNHNPDSLPFDEALRDERELTEDEMNRFVFVEDEDTKRTFREQLAAMEDKGVIFPTFFASTEY